MEHRLEYEVDAGLMLSAQQLAARLAKAQQGWRHQAVSWALFALILLLAFFLDLKTLLIIGLTAFLSVLAQVFYRYVLFKRNVAHLRRSTLILEDAGLCLRSAISEVRYPWREVRAALPQRGWLAIVMTKVPVVMPVPDGAFADDAARQAFLNALQAGMQKEGNPEAGEGERESGGEGQGAKSTPVSAGLRQEWQQEWRQARFDIRQTWRMLCFRAPDADASIPATHKDSFLLGLALFGLFTLSAQMMQYGLGRSEWVGLRMLFLAVAYLSFQTCVARVLGGMTVHAMRSFAFCLLVFCLPWIYTGNQSAGIAELLSLLGLTEAKSGISPYRIQALSLWLVIFWAIVACAFQFHCVGKRARSLYRVMLLSAFVFVGMSVALAYYHAARSWYAPPELETPSYAEAHYVEINEQVLYGQSRLLAESLARVRAGVKGRPELFFLGLGGEDQEVFLREARFAEATMAELFATQGHSLILVNHASTAQSQPMANMESLRQAMRRMGEQMNGAEDVLFLFLTSHGTQDFRLSLAFWPFAFTDITPQMLRQALDEAGIERRVVVISACYSGGFIPALQDENTLVITSAAADRTSFGCSDEDELTEFGRAYFAEALPQTRSIEAAFAQAAASIAAKEKATEREASLPQIAGGNAALRAQLQKIVKK
ncbi:MAG: C13 family peptidase [Zoogloeaceae bacterium]|jgi:hypothetical protein|nr:C13 family peptidase [Zoogloeaceae bacterium]